MFVRVISALLGLIYVGDAAFTLIAPHAWFAVVSGVADAGPYNQHFVRDIGAVALVVGLVLVWHAIAKRPPVSGLWVVAGLFSFHALIHLAELFAGERTLRAALEQDLGAVHVPALVVVCLAAWAQRQAARTG